MYNECFSHMSKTLRKDISFSHKVQMMRAKTNSCPNIPVYSLIFPSNIKDKYKINVYHMPHTHVSNKKRRWTTFQLVVALIRAMARLLVLVFQQKTALFYHINYCLLMSVNETPEKRCGYLNHFQGCFFMTLKGIIEWGVVSFLSTDIC